MATRYWVGGSGSWSEASLHWSNSSGGTPSASYLPTSADDVVFDDNSNTGTSAFTVTVDGDSITPSVCQDFSTSSLDGAMTLLMNGTSVLNCYGSMTLPATNLTWTGTNGCVINFKATTTGKTITTNGVSVGSTNLNFDGVGGAWTLGSAFVTTNATRSIAIVNGTFNTGNYNITTGSIQITSAGTQVVNLGSSTLNLSSATNVINITATAGLTWNADTSSIICSGATTTFVGAGLTYYNVEFSGGTGTKTINGANTFSGQFLVSNAAATAIAFGANQIFTGGALIQATSPTITGGFSYTGTFEFASTLHGTKSVGILQTFQNLKVTTPSSDGITNLTFSGNCTVSGTLTTTDGGSTSRRVQIKSNISGTQRTLTVATNSLINTDFQDIIAAGAASWTFGLGYGDLGNNSGITFDTSTLYWIGGTGNWSDGTKWSTSSGGSAANAVPAPQNSVIFDAGSNTGTNPFTVTVDGTSSVPSVCNDFSTGGAGGALDGTMTLSLGATAVLNIYGSLTLPATNLTWTAVSGSVLNFQSTSTGKTITTNGVSLGSGSINFNGVGGGWTLGSALTCSAIVLNNGTLATSNFNITGTTFQSSNSNTRTFTLGSSTYSLSGASAWNTTITTNLTFNANTSTINCTSTSPTFVGGGLTFYNVTFASGGSGTTTINGANTFNNLSVTSRSATGIRFVSLGDSQTVSGTLTLGATNTAIRRIRVASDITGTQRTITLNGTLATLADVDFRDIATAGTAGTWTGTRIGDCLGNSGITFTAAKTVYWNLAGTQNWSATGWATTNNGTPAVNNFPLAQDTATFTEAGAAGTVTVDTTWQVGAIQMADGVSNRTTAFTLAGTSGFTIYKNLTLFSNLNLSNTGTFTFSGQGTTQTITSAGVSFSPAINITSPSGTVQLLDNLTSSNSGTAAFTLTSGTLDLNEFNLSIAGRLSYSGTSTRSIDFGSAGKIYLTYNGGAAFTILNSPIVDNFTIAGTSHIEANGNNTAGSRAISVGGTSGALTDGSNSPNIYISAGTDTVTAVTYIRNLDFTGFSGTFSNGAANRRIYGNLVFSSTMTFSGSGSGGAFVFDKASGTQTITTNGIVVDAQVNVGDVNSTVLQLQDNLTMGSTRTLFLVNGTLDLSSGNRTLSTGFFSSSYTNTRAISFGTGQIDVTGNNGSVWNTDVSTNFSYTGTPTVNFTYSGSTGTRNIFGASDATATESNVVNINVTAGSDIVAVTGTRRYKNVNFTGFSGTLDAASSARSLYGSLTLSPTMTMPSESSGFVFRATSGTQTITSNGKSFNSPITIDGVGGTVSLQDALTMGSTRTLNLTNGTFTTNNYNVTAGRMAFNVGTRVLNMGSSSFTLTGTSDTTTSWNITDSTNLTINAGTSTINLAEPYSVGGKQNFVGGGFTYYNLNFSGGQDCELYGNNTFNNISNTTQPVTIKFEAGSTQTVNNFTVSGTAGNLVYLESLTPGTIWNLTKTSGTVTVTYCDITDSDANGGATFNCVNGVNGGNNTGWNFSSSSFSSGNFLAFF
jgi:hypothetical protein